MKILFVDGDLHGFLWDYECVVDKICGYGNYELVNAQYGYMHNSDYLRHLLDYKDSESLVVLTNSLVALSNTYGWDKENNCSNIYIWRTDRKDFVSIDELNQQPVRYAQNIEKMYVCGVFGFDDEIFKND